MTKNEAARKKRTGAVVAEKIGPFAGPVHAVFRSVTHAWKIICGALRAAGSTGSALIAGP
jgi:hypothetical protein